MISDQDKLKIISIAKKYRVSKVLLFGSSISSDRKAKDIDLAVEGLPDKEFFQFYSELIFGLSKSVDLVDLKTKSSLKEVILSEGIQLYG